MTDPDSMPDLLAALQASVDRARSETRKELAMTATTPTRTAAPKRTGRPAITDDTQLLNAALAIIADDRHDAKGYLDVTVGAVGARCGVKYSTFYRHYPSINTLIATCVDHHLADVTWPDTGLPWADYLTELADTLIAFGRRHRGIEHALLHLPERPAALLDVERRTVKVLHAVPGADPQVGWTAMLAVMDAGLAPGHPGHMFAARRRERAQLALHGFARQITAPEGS